MSTAASEYTCGHALPDLHWLEQPTRWLTGLAGSLVRAVKRRARIALSDGPYWLPSWLCAWHRELRVDLTASARARTLHAFALCVDLW